MPSLALDKVATRFALPVRAVAFSPCGEKVIVTGDDEGIKIISVAGSKVRTFFHYPLGQARKAVKKEELRQRVWHAQQVLRTLKAGPYSRALAYDPEGTYVASLSANGHLQVWELDNGKVVCSMPKAAPRVCPDPQLHCVYILFLFQRSLIKFSPCLCCRFDSYC